MKRAGNKFFGTVSRGIWTRALVYPRQEKQAWTITQNFFESSTFNGKPIKDQMVFDLFTFNQGLTFRGLSKDEPDSDFNQDCDGLVSRNPRVFRAPNLEQAMEDHQDGDVMGLPTTLKFEISKEFASGTLTHLPSHKEVMIMDLNNIPATERYMQRYDRVSKLQDSEGNTKNFAREVECTISGAHISAIVSRMNQRSLLQCNMDYNPLYIDQKALPEDLKQEYRIMIAEFYELIQDAPRLDPQKLQHFKETEQNFYVKTGARLNYNQQHMDAVLEHLGRGTKSLTFTADVPDPNAPPQLS